MSEGKMKWLGIDDLVLADELAHESLGEGDIYHEDVGLTDWYVTL